jgi:hypothetical protein
VNFGAMRPLTDTEISVLRFVKETLKIEMPNEQRTELLQLLSKDREKLITIGKANHDLIRVFGVLFEEMDDIEWLLTHEDPVIRKLALEFREDRYNFL